MLASLRPLSPPSQNSNFDPNKRRHNMAAAQGFSQATGRWNPASEEGYSDSGSRPSSSGMGNPNGPSNRRDPQSGDRAPKGFAPHRPYTAATSYVDDATAHYRQRGDSSAQAFTSEVRDELERQRGRDQSWGRRDGPSRSPLIAGGPRYDPPPCESAPSSQGWSDAGRESGAVLDEERPVSLVAGEPGDPRQWTSHAPARPIGRDPVYQKAPPPHTASSVAPKAMAQSRQKPWHHPYHNPRSAAQGPDQEAGMYISQRSPRERATCVPGLGDSAVLDNLPKRQESIPEARPNVVLHGEADRNAATIRVVRSGGSPVSSRPASFQSSSFPQQSVLEPGRHSTTGPHRNRGRASTLTLPQPELARQRGNFPPHHSPTYPNGYSPSAPAGPAAHQIGYGSTTAARESVTTLASSMWDDHRSRRDSIASGITDFSPASGTPPLSGHTAQQHSPLLFAPLSPFSGPRVNAIYGQGGQQSNLAATNPADHTRPGTPVSPLNMDDLSMEDHHGSTASSGMAVVPSSSGKSNAVVKRRSWDQHPSVIADRSHSPMMVMNAQARLAQGAPGRWTRGGGQSPRAGYLVEEAAASSNEAAHRQAQMTHQRAQAEAAGFYPHQGPPEGFALQDPRNAAAERVSLQPQQQPQLRRAGEIEPSSRQRVGLAGPGPQPNQVPVDRIAHSRRRRRPPYSYSSLIAQAISSSPEGRMTLREIYTWISNTYPGLYAMDGPESQGWQNTVRHNLSLNKSFVKVARTAQDIYESCSSGIASQSQAARGKGGWWMLDHAVAASQLGPGFRGQGEDSGDLSEHDPYTPSSGSRTPSQGFAGLQGSPAASVGFPGPSPDVGQRRLTRQRSYSDSVDRSAEQRRSLGSSSASASLGEPFSHSVHNVHGVHPGMDAARYARDSVPLAGRPAAMTPGGIYRSGPSVMQQGGEAIPSVLLPRPLSAQHAEDGLCVRPLRPFPSGRSRGYTTSAAEPSPLRHFSTSTQDQDAVDQDREGDPHQLSSAKKPLLPSTTRQGRPVGGDDEHEPSSKRKIRFGQGPAAAADLIDQAPLATSVSRNSSPRSRARSRFEEAASHSFAPAPTGLGLGRGVGGGGEEQLDRMDVDMEVEREPRSYETVKAPASSPGEETQPEEAKARMSISGLLNG